MAPMMTKDWIKSQCKKYKQYQTPYLNDRLYLQNQGFSTIENLEEYTEVKVLYLECNCIESLSGIHFMSKLCNLVVHKNNIGKIEHLDSLKLLDSLDISDNMLIKLDNLACCPLLTSLNVANNHLKSSESIEHLKQCSNLRMLDLSKNKLEDGEELIKVLKALPLLSCLYLSGNPCVRDIPNYRKAIISSIPNLKHLDQTPVYWSERIYANAWANGGDEAIKLARNDVCNSIQENERLQFEGMKRLRQQALKERMRSVEIPLLQFDEDELNPKPIMSDIEFERQQCISNNIKLSDDQVDKKTLEIFETPNFEDIDPKTEWKTHTMQEIDFIVNDKLSVKKEDANKEPNICVDNLNDCNISDLKSIQDNSKPSSSEDLIATKNKSIVFTNESLTTEDNNTIAFRKAIDRKAIDIHGVNDSDFIVKKNCHNSNDDFNDLPDFEQVGNKKCNVKDENDPSITNQVCKPMCSLQECNLSKKIDKKQENPMYIYISDSNDNVTPIPRFLNISKVDEPRNSKANDIEFEEFPNSIDLNSKAINIENHCLEANEVKTFFKIENKLGKHHTPNDTKIYTSIDATHNNPSQICDTNEEHKIILNDVNISLKEDPLIDIQKYNMNEGGIDGCCLLPKIKEEIDEHFFLADITNKSHPKLIENIPSLTMPSPRFLSFHKTKDCKWNFDDLPSQVSIEIKNINEETQINYGCDISHDDNKVISQETHKDMESCIQEECMNCITTIGSIDENSKTGQLKPNAYTLENHVVKDDNSKEDFLACLECNLLNRMDQNLDPRHQQTCTSYGMCEKQNQKNFMSPYNYSKVTQLTCNKNSTKEHMVEIISIESSNFDQSVECSSTSMETPIEGKGVSDFATNSFHFINCEPNEIKPILFDGEEIASPTLSNNLEDLLKIKSIVLSERATLEHSNFETSLSNETSSSDDIDCFDGKFNPIFGIESPTKNTNGTMLPLELLEFQSRIHFNTMFEDDEMPLQ